MLINKMCEELMRHHHGDWGDFLFHGADHGMPPSPSARAQQPFTPDMAANLRHREKEAA